MTGLHTSVLLTDVIDLLKDVRPPLVLDGTVGLGGHVEGLLDAGTGLRVIGIDRDEEALAMASARLANFGDRVRLIQGNYKDAARLLAQGFADETAEPLGGILLDVGVSSMQLDRADRGFSFRQNGPLDMRMDRSAGWPASEWLSQVDEASLIDVLFRFGEERYARRIARAIMKVCEDGSIETTEALKDIVHRAVPKNYFAGPIDPATRTFQAIRIAVNDELTNLETGLQALFDLLAPGGILAVISFHSLEDRIVKIFFRELASDCTCPPDLPECLCDKQVEAEILTRKPVTPSQEEIASNPRARSAKLRAVRKLSCD